MTTALSCLPQDPLRDSSLAELREGSHQLIASLQAESGAYPASPTFSAYQGFSWFRDGSFIADAMSAHGDIASAERFFDWCSMVLIDRRERVEWIAVETAAGRPPSGERMLPTRFTFDGKDGADEWWDFQTDGFGTWLWAIDEHCRRHGRDPLKWRDAIGLTIQYLHASWDRPCYDWWEEFPLYRHTSTLGAVAAGFKAASTWEGAWSQVALEDWQASRDFLLQECVFRGHLVKWPGSDALEGSLSSLVGSFEVISADSSVGSETLMEVERRLSVGGGVHRYLGDTFYGGGQWPLLSCFLGIAHLKSGNAERAQELLAWAGAQAVDRQFLPEQVDHHLISPGMKEPWINKWGPVATPLLWSHAMVMRLGSALDDFTTTAKGESR